MKVAARLIVHNPPRKMGAALKRARRATMNHAADVIAEQVRRRSTSSVKARIRKSSDADHAAAFAQGGGVQFIEGGRRPGRAPPPGVIRAWAASRGIPAGAAYAIGRRIARRGVTGVHMFHRGGAAASRLLAREGELAVARRELRAWRRR